jgi:hypothetical protein
METGARRRIVVGVVAALLFAWVAAYRFNTLGGALGGFDNDHFLHFVLAKQIEAGEQPVRDFLDAGLQGARPSLTYELSSLGQIVLGDNFRSEAVLTVAGVAAGGAITFVAGSALAPWPFALVTAVLSALVSPKLYGYPKVLTLAVAALLVVRYAKAPSWRGVFALAVWTAVAFLFRHDYAVYCGLGAVTVLACGRPWPAARRAGAVVVFGVAAVLAIAPSLWWIESHVGIRPYLQNGLEMSRREAQRTDLAWPVPALTGLSPASAADVLAREENTQAFLYYLFLALPAVALVAGARGLRVRGRDAGQAPALLALGVMTAALATLFLRGSLEARFGDMAPPVAVLGAALAGLAVEPGWRAPGWRVSAGAAALVLCVLSALAVWYLQDVRTELLRSGLFSSPAAVARQGARVSAELGRLPGAIRDAGASPSARAAAYLDACTTPADRVLVVGFAPEVLALADRRFAGGRPTVIPGFYEHPRYTRFTLRRLDGESVPLVLAEDEPYYAAFPELVERLRRDYDEGGRVPVDGDRSLRVLVRKGLASRPYGPAKWPCPAQVQPAQGPENSARMRGRVARPRPPSEVR